MQFNLNLLIIPKPLFQTMETNFDFWKILSTYLQRERLREIWFKLHLL